MSVSVIRGRDGWANATAKALWGAGEYEDAVRKAYGVERAYKIIKADVGASTSTDLEPNYQQREIFDRIFERSTIGQMNLRRVLPNVRMIRASTATRGNWVGEMEEIPLIKQAVLGSTLGRKKIATLIAMTKESLEAPGGLEFLQRDAENAGIEAAEETFLSSDAGSGDRPGGICSGAETTVATSDPTVDFKAVIDSFQGNLAEAVIITDPVTATGINLVRDSAGAFMFTDIGARGGSLLGIPVLVSRMSPRDSNGGQLVLVDPTGIAFVGDAVEVTTSKQTALAMQDEFDSSEPELISLFQTDTVALKIVMYMNWEVQRAGSVSVLTSVNY